MSYVLLLYVPSADSKGLSKTTRLSSCACVCCLQGQAALLLLLLLLLLFLAYLQMASGR
jgi:hypothetical protein